MEIRQIGTGTASRGPKVKASLRPIFKSTLWTALLCMLSGKIGQTKRDVPLHGGLGNCEGGFELPRSPGYVVPGSA